MYNDLIKMLRYCAFHDCAGEGEKIVGCTAGMSSRSCRTCNQVLQAEAADTIEALQKENTKLIAFNDMNLEAQKMLHKRIEELQKTKWIPVKED